MLDETLLLNKNIHQICYEIVKYEISCKKNTDLTIAKYVINFFLKYILGTNNVYPGIFLMEKLLNLDKKEDIIKKKLLIEIFVFLSICNKPVNENKVVNKSLKKFKLEECEEILKQELHTHRREEVILHCVDTLFKTKKDTLWKIVKIVVCSNKVKMLKKYVDSLELMNSKVPKKEFLLEAYKCVTSESSIMYFYDSSEYTSIIFQCMMKVNYIYLEMGLFDKHMNMYKACLMCPLDILKEEKEEIPIELPSYEEPKEVNLKKTSRLSKNILQNDVTIYDQT